MSLITCVGMVLRILRRVISRFRLRNNFFLARKRLLSKTRNTCIFKSSYACKRICYDYYVLCERESKPQSVKKKCSKVKDTINTVRWKSARYECFWERKKELFRKSTVFFPHSYTRFGLATC